MLTYWLMWLAPVGMALFTPSKFSKTNFIPWYLIGFIFILLIGFRYEVGGDWSNYIRHYDVAMHETLFEALRHGDPAHQFLNWLMSRLGWGVYGINVIYGMIFMVGLIKFSRDQINPWIAFSVAVPYMVIVVSMGYSRQGVAISLFMLALTYLNKKKLKTYIALLFLAALFHKTAILMLPLGFFLYGKGLTFRILMLIPIMYGAWDLFLEEQQGNLWKNYVEANLQSEGARIRVFMNFIPSLLLLIYQKEWKRSFSDYQLWFWIALGSIATMGLVDLASTAVDRVALYFIPIQLVVFARLPYLARKQVSPQFTKVLIVFGYLAVLFVWLNFATHADAWIPYQNIIFKDII